MHGFSAIETLTAEVKHVLKDMCRQIASLTESKDPWNAYSSVMIERLQGF